MPYKAPGATNGSSDVAFGQRKKSRFEQFRMSVPKDIRHIIGQSEWTRSLETTNAVIAAAKRGRLTAECKERILEARGELARRDIDDALLLLNRSFDRLARNRGSMDVAIAEQLTLVGSIVIDSWEPNGQPGERNSWGDWYASEPVADRQAIPSIDDDASREVFRLRAQLLENTGKTDGILYRKLAKLLLDRRVLKPIWFAVSYMTSLEPELKLDREDIFEAVAKAYLTRLADHHFASWPKNREAAVEAILCVEPPNCATSPNLVENQKREHVGLWAIPLSEALEY